MSDTLQNLKPESPTHPSHEWEDISYHGSPIYECRFCGSGRNSWDERSFLPCTKAEAVLKREAEKKEQEEHYEYLALLKREEREKYLHDKYDKKE